MPKEYPLASGEERPTVRRRVGTAFKLDDLFPYYEVGHILFLCALCNTAPSIRIIQYLFLLNVPVLLFIYFCLQDPQLRNLESRFALQQKIVEAAKKLANETELCKTVKKKRRRNFEDAMKTLQMIDNEINDYRVKTGKKPTQRASLIITGTHFKKIIINACVRHHL